MANLQKHRAHESLNTDSAATWVRGTLSVGTSGQTIDCSDYHTIHLQMANDSYFAFTNSNTEDISTGSDIYLMGGDTIYSLKVPKGLGDNVYFHIEAKSGSYTLKYVLA